MTEPSHDLRTETWPSREGPLHFPVLEGSLAALTDAVLASYGPGSAVVVDRTDVRDALLARGATQVRHLFAMRHLLQQVPDVATESISLRRWQDGDAELLAPVLIAAYGPGHPGPSDQAVQTTMPTTRATTPTAAPIKAT